MKAFSYISASFPVMLGLFLANLTASSAQFEPPIVIESPLPAIEGHFGVTSSVPDVTDDGRADFLISEVARVYLYDGVSRQLFRDFYGYDGFGINDLNGDHRGDVIARDGVKDVTVFDGSTGEVIHSWGQEEARAEVRDVAALPDISGDDRPEIAITVASTRRVVKIYDGASGALLRSLAESGLINGGGYGESVSGVPDVNGDGRGDVIVGAPIASRVFIYDGSTGMLLNRINGDGEFGRSVAGLGDVNGDGWGDVAVGANGARRAYIIDGASGNRLRTLSASGNPAHFGWFINRLPDVNGDGRDDVAVAGPPLLGPNVNTGAAYVFSGATGELLATLPRSSNVAAIPDINEDDLAEVLAGSPLGNSTDGVYRAGKVLLYLSKPIPKPPEPSALGWLGNEFKLRLSGKKDVNYELQASPDLSNWTTLRRQTHTNNVLETIDENAKSFPRRFYRTRLAE